MKKAVAQRKIACNILSNADRALLTVKDFVSTVIPNHPIHPVQRKTLFNGFYYSIALFFLVHKFALIFRTNIKLATIRHYALLATIFITGDHFSDFNFL